MTTNTTVDWPSPESIHTIVFDFDGVFTDNKVLVGQDGAEYVRCDRGDGYGFDLLRAYLKGLNTRIELFILTREQNPVVQRRATKLGLDCKQGVKDKLAFVTQYLSDKHSSKPKPLEGLIYIGNDLNDLPVIEVAGFSVVPDDAHPLVKSRASVVLPRSGGNGFLRHFVESFIGMDKMSWGTLHELILNC